MKFFVRGSRFISRRKIQSMIIRHPITITLRIIKHGFAVDLILATRKGNSISRVIDKSSTQGPILIKFVKSHHIYVMGTVLSRLEYLYILYLIILLFML